MIQNKTPIQKFYIEGKEVFVKREDLYSGGKAPSLSKLRGIEMHLNKLIAEGIKNVGILDTRISKSGWGLAYLAKNKGINVYCFYPKLKTEKGLPFIQKKEEELGAKVVPLKAGRCVILYSQAKKYMAEMPNSYMMPMGLVLPETRNAITELINFEEYCHYKTIVLSLGTGTICSGIIKGLAKNKLYPEIYGISCGMSCRKIRARIKLLLRRAYLHNHIHLKNFNHYNYYDAENIKTPFPSSPYYDKKAWRWLIENYGNLNKPILFWNIGV